MVLVNCDIFNLTTTKTVLPWSTYSTAIPEISVQKFYSTKVVSEVNDPDNMVLEFASYVIRVAQVKSLLVILLECLELKGKKFLYVFSSV